ncbi:MAG: efflux RND transporter periplasmic adaptor subunit [Syntrophales bacterium]|jgi:RND family efflux transporter MFP subunit|nr:efflux RND transporter periplasmic adaptor subunit [Syntrophales bacterium]
MRPAVRIPYLLVICLLALFCLGAGPVGYHLKGLLEPSDIVELSSQIPGIIEAVLVDRGDRVKKGQVLVRLQSKVEQATVELAAARLAFGKRKVQRNEELFQKKLISVHEKDEMETEVKIAELQLGEAMEKLRLRTIICPIDGVVMKRQLSPGEYVGEGSIMMIARVNPINVEVYAPASLFTKIRKGMQAEIRPESPVNGVYLGKVAVVDEVIDAASGTFGIRIELPNPDNLVNAGLNCSVRFLLQ